MTAAPRRGPTPSRAYKCPACESQFTSKTYSKRGTDGKVCPCGTWTSTYHLLRYEQTGCKPGEKRPFVPKPAAPKAATNPLNPPVTNREAHLSIALGFMLDSYDAMIASIPKQSQARSLIDGAFNHVPSFARDVLDRY